MQTFGANIVTGSAFRSNVQGHCSGSWHTAQGILGIVTKDKAHNPTFKNKYIQADAQAYGERIGQIASFFRREYIQTMNPNTSKPTFGNNCYNIQECNNKTNRENVWKITCILNELRRDNINFSSFKLYLLNKLPK